MCFGLPPATIRARCECMYETAGNCFVRSGVMKMPLITTSHRFAPSAGSRPENDEKTYFAVPPICLASAFAKSMSKPVGLPPVVAFSMGGNVGLSQYENPAAALVVVELCVVAAVFLSEPHPATTTPTAANRISGMILRNLPSSNREPRGAEPTSKRGHTATES